MNDLFGVLTVVISDRRPTALRAGTHFWRSFKGPGHRQKVTFSGNLLNGIDPGLFKPGSS